MRVALNKGDRVILLPTPKLFEVFKNRNFFLNDETRQEYANDLGSKEGNVDNIEQKYMFDYFFFKLKDEDGSYSIPYESVDFKETMIILQP